jgi:hypothetical protein
MEHDAPEREGNLRAQRSLLTFEDDVSCSDSESVEVVSLVILFN